MGMITKILQKTPPKKVPEGRHVLNPNLLKSRSDKEAFRVIVGIEAKKQAGGTVTKQEVREYNGAIRKLVNRGLMTPKTEEDE